MKEVRKAIRAALKNPALVQRAAKDAAESYVRGSAYREIDKMRQAEEEAEQAQDEKATQEASSGVAPTRAPVSAPVPAAPPSSPADVMVRASRK